jgi:hypothetical protein
MNETAVLLVLVSVQPKEGVYAMTNSFIGLSN